MDKDLAELEKTMRYAAERDIRVLLRKDLATFIAEYDRRGQVEQAATTLVEEWRAMRHSWQPDGMSGLADRLDALETLIRKAETP